MDSIQMSHDRQYQMYSIENLLNKDTMGKILAFCSSNVDNMLNMKKHIWWKEVIKAIVLHT